MTRSGTANIFNERAFQKIMDQSYSGISLLDENYKVLYRSPSVERITGWRNDARASVALAQSVHPEDREILKNALENLLTSPGESKSCLFRFTHADGHLIWLECVFTNMLSNKDVAAIICNYTDVTARINAEQRLSKTLEELSAYKYALDESAIVAITDHKGAIQHVNENFIHISGYSREELIGKDHRIINSGYHDKSYIKGLWRKIAGGEIWKGELKNKAKDGSYYWVDTSIIPFLDERGKPYQYAAIRSDITERKNKELAVEKTNQEIIDLIENIADGFLRLDDQLRYTYANQRLGKMLNMDPKALLGRYIWDVFPDAIGSQTYHAIQTAYKEQRFTSNEDYYPPLGLWQENRIYPNNGGLSVFVRDITLKKNEEEHLKLLESVITNTTDAVLITTPWKMNAPEPTIIYANKSFEKMSGYEQGEIIGRSPRFLQGPKTDRIELDRLRDAMENGQSFEATLINYKKSGEEFWNQFSVGPVITASGDTSHFIAIERDVTRWKNDQLQKALLTDISLAFATSADTRESLKEVLVQLVEFGEFWSAEAWLSDGEGRLDLSVRYAASNAAQDFYLKTANIQSFAFGEGLPGSTWEMGKILYWRDLGNEPLFLRKNAALQYGLKSAYGIPLSIGNRFLGVLVLMLDRDENQQDIYTGFFEKYSTFLSLEINRKQLDQELIQLFNSAPDVICIVGTDRRFKKVNPAMCSLLEYTREELYQMTIDQLIHPDDLPESVQRMKDFQRQGVITLYFENRYISKTGQIKHMAWTATKENAKKDLFCVAKDITEQKELARVLDSAAKLAKIGGWEVDLRDNSVYWSPTTRRILEVDMAVEVDLDFGYSFYQGRDREIMRLKLTETMMNGTICDGEFEIKTAKGNLKWVRVIAEAEFLNGNCIRLFGSFQDIHDLKQAEILAMESFKEKNNILENIGDAFFTVDRNWNVSYWNYAASQMLKKTKEETLNKNLWQCFPEAVDSKSYVHYHEALDKGNVVHFEDFFAPLQSWFEVSAYPSEKGLSVFFKDITERVTYIKAIEEHNKKLKEISWIQSHVVRAPLSRIMGLVELIKRNDLTKDEKAETLDYLISSANELDDVVKDITSKTLLNDDLN